MRITDRCRLAFFDALREVALITQATSDENDNHANREVVKLGLHVVHDENIANSILPTLRYRE
jgi:hypothetical protein